MHTPECVEDVRRSVLRDQARKLIPRLAIQADFGEELIFKALIDVDSERCEEIELLKEQMRHLDESKVRALAEQALVHAQQQSDAVAAAIAELSPLKNSFYRCPACNGWFEKGIGRMKCLVNHPPGHCCHYGDRKILEPR